MPSCDGSNCGACNCDTKVVEKIVYKDSKEEEQLKKKIQELQNELLKREYLEDVIKEIKSWK